MATKTLPESVPALDPIDRLISRGVKVRQLLQFHVDCAIWLADHQDDTFRICYFGDDGSVVTEQLDAVQLVHRTAELGWRADDEGTTIPASYLFTEAAYHCRRGVHYYATATDDESEECLPLCFPPSVIQAAVRRCKQRRASLIREMQMAARRKEVLRKREQAAAHKAFMHQMAMDEIKGANKAGKAIAYSTAMKRARIFVNDLCKSISDKLKADAAANKADAEANQAVEA